MLFFLRRKRAQSKDTKPEACRTLAQQTCLLPSQSTGKTADYLRLGKLSSQPLQVNGKSPQNFAETVGTPLGAAWCQDVAQTLASVFLSPR